LHHEFLLNLKVAFILE